MSEFTRKLKGHDLSYEAREAACHANQAYHKRLIDNSTDLISHAYRAALQEIIREKCPSMRHGCVKLTTRKAHLMTFQQYAEKALRRLGLDVALTTGQLARADQQISQWRDVVAFFTLRLSLVPVIETQLLLDRVLYLAERGISSWLLPVFKPEISPRNFVLIALKPQGRHTQY